MSASYATAETFEVVSEKQGTAGFRLEIDRLDTRPFSEDFSSFMRPDEGGDFDTTIRNSETNLRAQDTSYNIECVTNIGAIAPEWDGDIDEIVIMSHKIKGLTATPPSQNPGVPSALSGFEILYDLVDSGKTKTTLVRSSLTGKLCVLKRLRKTAVNIENSTAHLWSERVILEALKLRNIPFIVNLQTCFDDEDYCNLVVDYYPGGDLLSCIAREGPLQPERVLLYSSEIAQAIGALHSLKIIHHNLRAENVMIDPRGHIVLTGFGRAESTSLCASPNSSWLRSDLGESQPPESILGWKHDFTVDCWSFGILLYMMQVGRHPFSIAADSRNQDAIRYKIIRDPIPFHALSGVSSVAQDLVIHCLERNPALRLSIQQIQAHEYFSTVKWLAEPGGYYNTQAHRDSSIASDLRPGDPQSSSAKLNRKTSTLSTIDGTLALNSDTAARQSITAHCKPGFRLPGSPIQNKTMEKEPQLQSKEGFVEIGQDTVLDIKPQGIMSQSILKNCGGEGPRPVTGDISAHDYESLSGNENGPSYEARQRRSTVSSPMRSAGHPVSSSAKPSAKLRKKFRSMHFRCIPYHSSPKLPKGVEQRGKGIGFTFSVPAANQSSLTVCSTVPNTCYGLFWRSLSLGHKKLVQPAVPKACISDKSIQDLAELDQRPAVYTFMNESADSFPVEMSPFLSSAFSHTAIDTPNTVDTFSSYTV